MANELANASDWWLNKLNTWGLLPANVATLARSVSAKQLGDAGFRPRPLTADNFSDAELDAIYRLAHDASGNMRSAVQSRDYDRIGFGKGLRRDENMHGYDAGAAKDYTSPMRVVSTTLGQFGIGNGAVRDTYDFNRFGVGILRMPDGRVKVRGRVMDMSQLDDYLRRQNFRSDGAYGRMRVNALRLAHNDSDPDTSKIKALIPLADIRRRLEGRLGSFDLNRQMSRREILGRAAAAGGLTGAAAGAALGLAGGAASLFDPERRKRWKSTLLKSTLLGAGIAGAAGAAAGGLGARRVFRSFVKKSADVGDDAQRKRRSRWTAALSGLVAFGLPAVAAAGLGAVGAGGVSGMGRRLFGKADKLDEVRKVWFDDPDSYYRFRGDF